MNECPKCGAFHYNVAECYCSACGYDAVEEYHYSDKRTQRLAESFDESEED